MHEPERVLSEYYRNEVSKVAVPRAPASGIQSAAGSSSCKGRTSAVWAELLWYAALVAIVLLPCVTKLPPPLLAVKSSIVYRQYVHEQVHDFENYLEQWFEEEQ